MKSKYELDEEEMRAMLDRMEMLEAILVYATAKAGGTLVIPRSEMIEFMEKYQEMAVVMERGPQESIFRILSRAEAAAKVAGEEITLDAGTGKLH